MGNFPFLVIRRHLNCSLELWVNDLHEAFCNVGIQGWKFICLLWNTDLTSSTFCIFCLVDLCQPISGLSGMSRQTITSRRKNVFRFFTRVTCGHCSHSSLFTSFLLGVESPSRNLRSERFACNRFLVHKNAHSNRSSSGEGLPGILACEREKIVDMFCQATGAVSSLRDGINLTVSWITFPLDLVSLRSLFGLYNLIHPRVAFLRLFYTTMLRCDAMSSSQEPLVLFGRDDECAGCCHHLVQKMTIVRHQRNIRRKIFSGDQLPYTPKRKHLNEHVCPDTLQCPPVPTHLRAIRCKSLLSTFPT